MLFRSVSQSRYANINSINAGASKTKQETKNLVVEGKILSADALTRAAQNEQSLQIGRSQIYLNHAIADKTHEEKELIGKQINLATAAYDELQEKIENLRVTRGSMLIQQFQARFDMYMRSQEFNMMCRKLAQDIKESDSRIQLNLQQTKDLMSTMIPRILNLNASTYATKQQGKLTAEQITTELYRQTGIDISNQQMKLNLDSDKTYKDVERSVGIATEILNSLSYFILDMVAHTSVKTPTAAAELLIAQLQMAEKQHLDIASYIYQITKSIIEQQQQFFAQTQMHIKHTLRTWVTKRTHLLNRQKIRLTSARRLQIMFQKNKLDLLAKNIETHSPAFLLKHGYTITTINGKRIHSVAQLKTGEKIRTFVHDGSFESEITSKD